MSYDNIRIYQDYGLRQAYPCRSPVHEKMHSLSQEALRITMEINNVYHTRKEIIRLMSQLTGRDIDESFGSFPPFYTIICN